MCPETRGRECQNFGGLERGARRRALGTEGAHLLLSRALGSRLSAPRSCYSSVWVLAAGSLGFPLTCPGDAKNGRAGLGRLGWEEARPQPSAGESLGTRGDPGSAPYYWPPSGAESSVPAGRRPPPSQVALCTLPSALSSRPSPCLPRYCSLTRRLLRRPARLSRSALRASARSQIRASEADRCAPGSDPDSQLRGRGSRTRTHTVKFQAGTGSRALVACCCEATPQPQRRKREGDRERAGGGGGRRREEGWGDGEGGRDREFPPPPCSQVPPGINSRNPLLERKELRFLGGGDGWKWSEGMEGIEERGVFCPLSLPRYEVVIEDLRSLEQDPRSCQSNSQSPNPSRQITWI